MAPKRRPRKVGLKRMDAAIDALTPMGFTPDVIRRKVKELLKMYGDEGWFFIEEAAYKLLIECILEDQEQGEPSLRDLSNEAKGEGGEEAEPSGSGPALEARSNQETALAIPPADSALATPLADSALAIDLVDPQLTFSPAEHETNQGKIATSSEVNQTDDIALIQEKIAALTKTFMLPSPPGFEHYPRPHPGYASTKRKRKPCLGLIGPKDDNDFVLLEPAPVLGWKNRPWPRKRKSRWDVGPYD